MENTANLSKFSQLLKSDNPIAINLTAITKAQIMQIVREPRHWNRQEEKDLGIPYCVLCESFPEVGIQAFHRAIVELLQEGALREHSQEGDLRYTATPLH